RSRQGSDPEVLPERRDPDALTLRFVFNSQLITQVIQIASVEPELVRGPGPVPLVFFYGPQDIVLLIFCEGLLKGLALVFDFLRRNSWRELIPSRNEKVFRFDPDHGPRVLLL